MKIVVTVPSAATVWGWPLNLRPPGKSISNVSVSAATKLRAVNENLVPTGPVGGAISMVGCGIVLVVVGGGAATFLGFAFPPPHAVSATNRTAPPTRETR